MHVATASDLATHERHCPPAGSKAAVVVNLYTGRLPVWRVSRAQRSLSDRRPLLLLARVAAGSASVLDQYTCTTWLAELHLQCSELRATHVLSIGNRKVVRPADIVRLLRSHGHEMQLRTSLIARLAPKH